MSTECDTKIDRRKLMDDGKLERLRKAREKKEELRAKREADKLDLLKKKVLVEMGQQEKDAEEKQRLKEEKWARRKAELLAEMRNFGTPAPVEVKKPSGKVLRSGKAGQRRAKPMKKEEPPSSDEDTEMSEDGEEEEDAICLF